MFSYVSAVPAGWNFFSAHPGAWEIHYSIFSFHTQIPLLFSALFTLTPAWLNSEVEISGKRNTQSPSISFWQHRIIGKTFFLCLWYTPWNVVSYIFVICIHIWYIIVNIWRIMHTYLVYHRAYTVLYIVLLYTNGLSSFMYGLSSFIYGVSCIHIWRIIVTNLAYHR